MRASERQRVSGQHWRQFVAWPGNAMTVTTSVWPLGGAAAPRVRDATAIRTPRAARCRAAGHGGGGILRRRASVQLVTHGGGDRLVVDRRLDRRRRRRPPPRTRRGARRGRSRRRRPARSSRTAWSAPGPTATGRSGPHAAARSAIVRGDPVGRLVEHDRAPLVGDLGQAPAPPAARRGRNPSNTNRPVDSPLTRAPRRTPPGRARSSPRTRRRGRRAPAAPPGR